MDKYEILSSMISHSNKIVFFTGAGISVPSGIPDFRSADGLYNEKREDKICFSEASYALLICYVKKEEQTLDYIKEVIGI